MRLIQSGRPHPSPDLSRSAAPYGEPRPVPAARGRVPLAALAAVCAVLPVAGETSPQTDARAFLAHAFALDAEDLGRIDQGQVVAGTLPSHDKRDVTTFGVVRVQITPDHYVTRLKDIAAFKKTEAVIQIGTFGDPPSSSDVAALTVDEPDLRAFRGCRPGKCDVQLSADGITRIQREADWARPGAEQRASAAMRDILVEYAAGYLRHGSARSIDYADRADAMNTGREFASLLDGAKDRWAVFPTLRRHLLHFPATSAPDLTDLLYWSKEDVGRRTVTSITHLAILRLDSEATLPVSHAIASKQIYATHYYDASLGLTMLLPDRTAASPAIFLAYENRSRVDLSEGFLGGVTRRLVTSRARSTVAGQLQRLQLALEQRRQP